MKRILAITVLIMSLGLITGRADAQTYFLGNGFTNGGSVTTCGGFFYDTDPAGTYGSNQNYVVTFIPASIRNMQLNFLDMVIGLGDSLEVFDGLTVTSPRLAVFGVTNSGSVAITASNANTSRALTVRFRSDANISAIGWRAQVKCVPPCQPITGSISVNSSVIDNTGANLVCSNTPLTFAANVAYPQSGPLPGYTQTNALNRFKWEFNGLGLDSNAVGASTLIRPVLVPGGYRISLTVTDTNNCSQLLTGVIKTSIKPTVTATSGLVCIGDTSTITGSFQSRTGFFIPPPLTSYYWGGLPPFGDNAGMSGSCYQEYRDSIVVNKFAPGTTLNNASDFVALTIKMEHSYIGDINMKLVAPNGTEIPLKLYGSGGNGNTDLGEPVDVDGTPNIEGVGYVYRFTPLPTATQTWAQATIGAPTHTFVANNGITYTARAYLPAGDYKPEAPFGTFNNTSVNGAWKLVYCDFLAVDNGKIFYWSLDFAPSVPLANGGFIEPYNIGVRDARFMPATGLLSTVTTGSSTVGRVLAPTPLVYNYTYRVTDSANCSYDTVVKVFANPRPLKASFTGDTVICRNATSTLRVAVPAANTTYQWYSNAQGTGTPITTGTSFTTPALTTNTTYYVKATNIAQCSKTDTISIRILQPVATPVVVVNNPTLNTLTFTWAAIPGAIGYQVSVDSGVTYITPSSGATGTTHTLAGLRPFLTRSILVRALATIACQNSEVGIGVGTTLLDDLYVPNAFTPNGDGKNDIWKPYGWLIKELSINIFNQWGQQIYATRDANGGWDGSVKGKQQPVGVYVFVMRVVDQNGRVLERKGSINLVR